MMINREHIVFVFQSYVEKYDLEDTKIRLKVDHTFRVAALCDRIAKSLQLPEKDVDLAWSLGMFHDIGRFEQVRRYGTFLDSQSVNHAMLSADILFKEGLIKEFFENDIVEDYTVMEKAIRYHNVLNLPESLTERELLFAQILRDADKIDILKVNHDIPMEEIYDVPMETLRQGAVSDVVIEETKKWETLNRDKLQEPIDHLISHICLVFGICYLESFHIIKEQGYLDALLDFDTENEKTKRCLMQLRESIMAFGNAKENLTQAE